MAVNKRYGAALRDNPNCSPISYETKVSNNGVLPQTEVNFTELAAQLEATNQAAQQALSSAESTAQPEPQLKRARTAGYYESGMALNITHGMQVVDYLITYGAAYNPSNTAITVASLQAMNTQGQTLLDASNVKRQDKKVEVDARQVAFGDLKPLATRIINELEASGAPKATVQNARHYLNKMRGMRIIKINPDEPTNHISASQTSFTEQIQHFTDLINVLSGCPEYNPNVEDLKLVALQQKRDAMISTNAAVSTKQAVWSTSRIERNQFFNAPVTGFVETYLAVKNAVKAIFGASSPQYQQVSSLTFRRIDA